MRAVICLVCHLKRAKSRTNVPRKSVVRPSNRPDSGEQEPDAFWLGESCRRRVATDVDVDRVIGRILQCGGLQPGQALLHRRLAPSALRAVGELGARLGGVAVCERIDVGGCGFADLLLV